MKVGAHLSGKWTPIMSELSVLEAPRKRRRFIVEFKARVALEHSLNAKLVHKWIRTARQREAASETPAFFPMPMANTVAPEPDERVPALPIDRSRFPPRPPPPSCCCHCRRAANRGAHECRSHGLISVKWLSLLAAYPSIVSWQWRNRRFTEAVDGRRE